LRTLRNILFRAFKKESALEMWAANDANLPFVPISTYKICATSGTLGPKRRFGDVQVLEGFYSLDWFNPQSNFFLSLHISYPNPADRILGSHENPGGDIFLHGNCVTIGCLPITDDGIKEVYWVSVLARTSGQQNIPIYISPARLDDAGFRELATAYRDRPDLIAFWSNLKEGYDRFERDHKVLKISASAGGTYRFEDRGAKGH
jgi:murein L,D-transpeptidase YafK